MTGVQRRNLIDVTSCIVIVMSVLWVWWVVRARTEFRPGAAVWRASSAAFPSDPVSLDGLETDGERTAPVVVIEFADFQCPYCKGFVRDTLPVIRSSYINTGKVLFAFHQLPLSIHPLAMLAAEDAECAAEEGKFWAMHDRLFEEHAELSEDVSLSYAQEIGLDVTRFRECLQTHRKQTVVESETTRAASLGVSSTPTFFVGTALPDGRVRILKALSGAASVDEFRNVLEATLRSSTTRGSSVGGSR